MAAPTPRCHPPALSKESPTKAAPPQKSNETQGCVINLLAQTEGFSAEAMTRAVQATGCTLRTCDLHRYGDRVSGLLFAQGTWYQLEKLERLLDGWNSERVQALYQRTSRDFERPHMVPFRMLSIGTDREGLLGDIFRFIHEYGGILEEANCDTEVSNYTSAPLCKIEVVFTLDADTSVARLRDEYCSFCEHHNLDGQIEAFN